MSYTDNSKKYSEWPMLNNNNTYGNFTPSDASIKITSSSSTYKTKTNDILKNRKSPDLIDKSFLENNEIKSNSSDANNLNETTPSISLRAPLARAAAKKKKAENKISHSTSTSKSASPLNHKTKRYFDEPSESLLKIVDNSNPMISFIEKAETLLRSVKSYTNNPSVKGNNLLLSPITLDNEIIQELEIFDKKFNSNDEMTKVECLINGLPEIFEEELDVDDEAIERLLKIGGSPPSELMFPSFHLVSQKVMDKLSSVNYMTLSFQQINIHNPRFGCRKDSSFISCSPPSGVKINETEHNLPSQIILTEFRMFELYKKDKKAGLLDDYFTGKVDMNKKITWPIKLIDSNIKSWINGDDGGHILLELHSYLVSPKIQKGTPSIRLGYVKIPLSSLLLTPNFDAIVTAEILSDEVSIAMIHNRLLSMPNGLQLRNAKPIGSSVGHVSIRIHLSDTENTTQQEAKKVSKNSSDYYVSPNIMTFPAYPTVGDGDGDGDGDSKPSPKQGEPSNDKSSLSPNSMQEDKVLYSSSIEKKGSIGDTCGGHVAVSIFELSLHLPYLRENINTLRAKEECSEFNQINCIVSYKIPVGLTQM